MLAIRLQRVGRKKYPVYRVAVQEAQRHPSSGRVVAYVGSYNPHTKAVRIDKDKVETYLKTGAQPSPRVIRLLEAEKIKLPDWVKKTGKKEKTIRNPDKLRRNQASKPAEDIATTKDSETEAESAPKTDEAQSSTSDSSDSTAATEEIPTEPKPAEPAETEPAAKTEETPEPTEADEKSEPEPEAADTAPPK